ncbi:MULTISPECIES: phage structural protein [Priestia]|uniref:DUF3277 domain-containing protein n=2 Tax=Priestia TaxID=2800373 RepID=A0AA86I085_PRIMG|nr:MULTISPECIES: phage protein [Priestia]AXI29450.1 DUF3277 domain-containing protein [Priestia megaterium]WEA46810.1 DUF3277 family protein [Priestia aryabhattai]
MYDAKLVTVTVDGRFITGFADGSFVSSEKDEESFSTKVGAQGDVAVSKTNNPLGTITMTVQQESPSNTFLKQKAKSLKPFPIWVTAPDGQGKTEKSGGTQALIKKSPGKEYEEESGSREYEFQVFDYTEA